MANSPENVKHKPSKKVVLEDVLTSLQDLVNNEFAAEFADSAPRRTDQPAPNVLNKGSTPGLRKRGRPRKYPLSTDEATEASRNSKNTPKEVVVLEPDNYTYSQEQGDLFGEHAPRPGVEKKRAKPTPQPKAVPVNPPQRHKSRAELESARNPANLKVVDGPKARAEKEPRKNSMKSKQLNTAEHLGAVDQNTGNNAASLDWADDIPVLTEEVDPHSLDVQQLQEVVDRSLKQKDLAPEARAIAVKVAARLNIEMRESGQQLDIKTIMRLQALLKEALEPKA